MQDVLKISLQVYSTEFCDDVHLWNAMKQLEQAVNVELVDTDVLV